MVDKKLTFLDKNERYGVVMLHKNYNQIVYNDGQNLKYGDPAEIFCAIPDEEFIFFVESAIASGHYLKEHYGFVFGYQHADFDDEEIKENEVQIFYADIVNIISKSEFYKLCLLLCNAKLRIETDKQINNKLNIIKIKLEDKLNQIN